MFQEQVDSGFAAFMGQFTFSGKTLFSIEAERFLVSKADPEMPVAAAPELLRFLDDTDVFGPELSACQIECRNRRPTRNVRTALDQIDELLAKARALATRFNCRMVAMPAAPAYMPQDISPKREYRKIANALNPQGQLLPAFQVTSDQLNIGCRDWSTLLDRYNRITEAWSTLEELYDFSKGKRDALYRQAVGKDPTPRTFESPFALYKHGLERGWAFKLRDWYDYLRIKPGGIIEVRRPDATDNDELREAWIVATLTAAGISV